MSEKSRDNKNRWRSVTVAFRVSPEEAYHLDMQAKTSGMLKQDFIIKRLMNEEIIVRPNIRIQRYLENYLIELSTELKRVEKIEQDNDVIDNIKYIVELISEMTPN